jgi:hypothetical protein
MTTKTQNQYLLSVWHRDGEPLPTGAAAEKMFKDVDALNAKFQKAGAWVFAGGLHPTSATTTVQVKKGDVIVTDGPFSEAKEHIGGFWIIKCADLDAALQWAKEATVACGAPVEVRPFQEAPAE